MVEHIAQAAGHHHLLGPGQAVEGGVGGGRWHACGLPVDRSVAVVRPLSLDETGAQLDGLDLAQQGLPLGRVGFLREQGPQGLGLHSVGLVEDQTVLPLVTGGRDHRALGQRGPEGAGGGVVIAAIHIGGVAQAQGQRIAGLLAEAGKGRIVLQRGQRGVGLQTRDRTGQQRAQRRAERACLERNERGLQIGCAQHGNRAPGQRVEVVGVGGARLARLDGQRASCRDGAGDVEFARGVDGQGGIGTGLHGHRGGADHVETCARRDRTAAVEVDVVAGRQFDTRTVASGDDGCTFKHRQAGASDDLHPRVCSARLDRRGAQDRMAGRDLHPAAGVQGLDAAALVGRQADRACTGGEHGVDAGTAGDVDVHQFVTLDPARNLDLLGDVHHCAARRDAGIGRAQGVLHVLAAHLQQARRQRERVGRLQVAHHVDAVGLQRGRVGEARQEVEDAHRLVLDVAHTHQHAGGTVSDRDRAESVRQGGQVAHAKVEGAGGAVARQVAPEGALAGGPDAVVLRGVLGAQRQRPRATHAVVARDEVDVIGHDADRAPAGRRGQHAAAQGQQGFALGEFDVDAAGSDVQAAVGPVVGQDVEVIGLSHDDVSLRGRPSRERVDDGEFRHRGVDRALDALRLQAQQRLRRVEGGPGHVQHACGVQREVGGTPARAAAGDDLGVGGVVAHLDAVQRIGEVNGTGALDELVVVQPDRLVSRAADGRQDQPVSAAAARHLESATTADEQQVVALARVHDRLAGADVDGVIAATAEHGVGARTHVDDLGCGAADKSIVALTALVAYARDRAALEDILAGAATDDAAGRAPENVEVVLAVAAVEVEHGVHALADVDRIAALAAAGHDAVHAVVRDTLTEGLDRDAAVGVRQDGVRLIDGVVIEVPSAVAPGDVARVQVQGVAILARDHGPRAEAPQVAARHGDPHHRDACGHVGADRGEVDRGAEACERDVDLEQAEVNLEVQRAVGAAGKARLAAEQDAHPGLEVQRPETDVEAGRATDQEVAVGLDEALDVDDQGAEEVQRALEVQAEDLVDDLDAAFKRHLEGQHLELALDLEVEQGVGGNRVRLVAAVGQRGVGAAARVDLQRGVGEDAQLRHAELELRLHAQRKEGGGAVHAKGRRAGDLDLAEVAQVQRQVHRGLHACAVDQQVHRAAQLDRAQLNGRPARDAQ